LIRGADGDEGSFFKALEPSQRAAHTDMWLAIVRAGTKIGGACF